MILFWDFGLLMELYVYVYSKIEIFVNGGCN